MSDTNSDKTIRSVIWDMGNVILRTEDWHWRNQWASRLGITPSDLSQLVFCSEISQKASLGLAGDDDIWAWVRDHLHLSDADALQLRYDFFAGDQVDYSLINFSKSLRPTYKIGMITNAWPDIRHVLSNELHIADAFDDIVISAEVGMIKPDARIYRLSLDNLGVLPAQAVFIDDFKRNVEGAQMIGMHAIRFQTTEQTLEELKSLLKPAC